MINIIKENNKDLININTINLIIGWDVAKEFGASIRNNKISDNLYWTFSPLEKRTEYDNFMVKIYGIYYNDLIKNITYKNINPMEWETPNEFLKIVYNLINGGLGFLNFNRLYVYKENKIFHIDIGLLNFMSWDILDDILKFIELCDEPIINFKEELKYLDIKYIPFLIYNNKKHISI